MTSNQDGLLLLQLRMLIKKYAAYFYYSIAISSKLLMEYSQFSIMPELLFWKCKIHINCSHNKSICIGRPTTRAKYIELPNFLPVWHTLVIPRYNLFSSSLNWWQKMEINSIGDPNKTLWGFPKQINACALWWRPEDSNSTLIIVGSIIMESSNILLWKSTYFLLWKYLVKNNHWA